MYCVAGGHEAPTLKFILHVQMKSRYLDVKIKNKCSQNVSNYLQPGSIKS